MALPNIFLTGNLTQDIELFTTKNGKHGAKINFACNEKKIIQDNTIEETIFLTGIVWGKTAEHAVQTLKKGDTITISGKLSQRTYMTKENVERSIYEVQIDSLSADLRRTPYFKADNFLDTKKDTTISNWNTTSSDNNFGVNF